ncbi:MAG: OmpA family protein [Bacteroidota bacterium]
MKRINLFLVLIASSLMFSCVSSKKFNEMEGRLMGENRQLRQEVMNLNTRNNELSASEERLRSMNDELNQKIGALAYEQELLTRARQSLERDKANLEAQIEAVRKGTSSEIENLLAELQRARGDLNQREDKLREAEKILQERNARLIELQEALRQKEEAVNRLRQTVTNALTGFTNNGLTVFEKNGKVYVSLEEQLLFKSGQWEVDPRGQQALRDLAAVLAQNPDINVMVEGHTDDVPMRGANQVRDNWDLSVMRATAVTKVLLQNKQISPERIIAAGRSEYLPLDPGKTPEARRKNRRTEIILTPKLDELLRLMEGN